MTSSFTFFEVKNGRIFPEKGTTITINRKTCKYPDSIKAKVGDKYKVEWNSNNMNSYIRLGFTGTRIGMTKHQKDAFKELIKDIKPYEFRHGDCIGADFDAHKIILKETTAEIIKHPPIDNRKRAFTKEGKEMPPKKYLDRDKDIIQNSDIVIATPKENEEVLRSGTWATIRYAKEMRKKIYIIYPDGEIQPIYGDD